MAICLRKVVPESQWNRDHPLQHATWSTLMDHDTTPIQHDPFTGQMGTQTGKAAAKLLDYSHSGLDGFNCRWILKFITRWKLFFPLFPFFFWPSYRIFWLLAWFFEFRDEKNPVCEVAPFSLPTGCPNAPLSEVINYGPWSRLSTRRMRRLEKQPS